MMMTTEMVCLDQPCQRVLISSSDNEATPSSKRPQHNDVPGGFTYVDKDGEPGRRRIRIEYISDKSRRHITFSKRKAGIMKKVCDPAFPSFVIR